MRAVLKSTIVRKMSNKSVKKAESLIFLEKLIIFTKYFMQKYFSGVYTASDSVS
ncbi:MAG: hypothetical protein AMXMBFR50_25580 [Ignavibacterium album]|jgi:hypothetical protein